LVVLVANDDRAKALAELNRLMAMHRWTVMETLARDTYIESRVRETGGEVWAAYQVAQKRGYWIEIFPDHFGSGNAGMPPPRAPRLTEAFVDRILSRAGGRRLSAEERNHELTRNADYLLDGYIIELKDIQEEGMEKPEHQVKLANLFRPYFPGELEILIDPAVLSPRDLQTYAEIVGAPLRSAIKSAANQVRATKAHLKDPSLHGGIIVLNSGYYSISPELFEQMVVAYAKSLTGQIEAVVCITNGFATDGFNAWMVSRFHPPEEGLPVEQKLGEAYGIEEETLMNDWARAGFDGGGDLAPIPSPLVFQKDGVVYRYFPDSLPPPWTPEAMSGG
ncbi:MAG TPA: hypothetical protein VEB66_01555, partial [Opitutaceae bacterium]|nr:hypothetical protein [Opitutaceae bacterium]